jgi:hypothetical protein
VDGTPSFAQPARLVSVREGFTPDWEHLGLPLRHYRSVGTWRALLWLVIGAAWLVGWVYFMATHLPGFRLQDYQWSFQLLFLGFGPIAGPFLIIAGLRGWLRPVDVLICSGGLILLQRRSPRTILWEDVASLEVESYRNFTMKEPVESFQLRLKHGKKIAFNSIFGGIWFNEGRELFDDLVEVRDDFLRERGDAAHQKD